MREYGLLIIFLFFIFLSIHAQVFEGVLKIDYQGDPNKRSAADVYVKGNKFFIKKIFGGCDRYDGYIYDTEMHTLNCISAQNPKIALRLNIDQIMDIYEKKNLKPGFSIHVSEAYDSTTITKHIDNVKVLKKEARDSVRSFEIWVSDLQINNYSALIPVLRLAGFWDDTEDEDNVILETRITNTKTRNVTSITVVPVKSKVDDNYFILTSQFQQVDMDKFLINEVKSPRFGELVKAFAGF